MRKESMRSAPEANPSGRKSGTSPVLTTRAGVKPAARVPMAGPRVAEAEIGTAAQAVSRLSSARVSGVSEEIVTVLLEDEAPQITTPSRPFAELDSAAREVLLMEHMQVVRYIARRIHERLPQHVEMDDLISAGMVGLLDAFNKFDTGKNVQFRSYAQFRIRGAILDSLRTLDWSPRDLRRKGRAIEDAMHTLTSRLGRTPQENEVATEMSMSLIEYQQLLGELKGLEIGSLNVEHTEDSGEEELAYVPNSPEDDPLFRCLKNEMKDRLVEAIGELPEKERLVLTLYYYEEMTMKEIGLTLNVVESRVSQIHSSAVLHLRSKLAHGAKSIRTQPQAKRPAVGVRTSEPGTVNSSVNAATPLPVGNQRLWRGLR